MNIKTPKPQKSNDTLFLIAITLSISAGT